MNCKPSFFLVRLLTKHYFSEEVKASLALFIANEILLLFEGVSCSVIFDNPVLFQRSYIDEPIPFVKNVTQDLGIRPTLFIEVLTPVGAKSKDVCSEADLNTLKKKLEKNAFLEDIILFT
jgi:hypothetical protein